MRPRPVLATAAATVVGIAMFVALAPAPAGAYTATPVNSRRVIGYSVKHRPIVAYRLGNPRSKIKALLLGQMHGDEHAGVRVARSIIKGTVSVEGIDLWVIPTMNPDGNVANTRQNAHHVDLNRNWPDHWAALTGMYYSGPEPLSEPETRAMRSFLLDIHPHYIVSLHQPLYGVDTTDGGALDHAFRDRLADNLNLPLKAFRCWGFCHGTMTGWYTTHRYGIAETVEFGWHPTLAYLTGRARKGIVHALGGHFGSLSAHNPRSAMYVGTGVGTARLHGWVFDFDATTAHVRYDAFRDGTLIRTGWAAQPSPVIDEKYGITGDHAYLFSVTAAPGPHTFCITFHNIGAGTTNPRRCSTVTVPAPSPSPTPTPTPSPSATA
jgi:murein peptide amidase A